MSYATIADFKLAFGDEEAIALTNLDNQTLTLTTVNEPILQKALNDATAEIDGYVQKGGYVLPLPTIPEILNERCLDIARYWLDRNNVRETVRWRFLDAISWLKDLAKGVVDLGIPKGSPIVSSDDTILFYSSDRTFDQHSLRDYGSLGQRRPC